MRYKLTITETGSRSSALLKKKKQNKTLKITNFGIRLFVWKIKNGSHGKKLTELLAKT